MKNIYNNGKFKGHINNNGMCTNSNGMYNGRIDNNGNMFDKNGAYI